MQQQEKQNAFIDDSLLKKYFQAMLDIKIEVRLAPIVEEVATLHASLFEALFQQHSHLLSVYVYNLLNSIEATQDIVQDTWFTFFCKLQSQSSSWLEEIEVRAWLLTVAKNKALNYLKVQRRYTSLEADKTAFIFEPHMPPFDYPENITMRSEVCEILYQALEALSKPQCKVLILRFLYDFGLDEIAYTLAMKHNTVRSHLDRGKKHLRQILLDRGVEQDDLAFWTWPDESGTQRKKLLSSTASPGE